MIAAAREFGIVLLMTAAIFLGGIIYGGWRDYRRARIRDRHVIRSRSHVRVYPVERRR